MEGEGREGPGRDGTEGPALQAALAREDATGGEREGSFAFEMGGQ